jgi:hypothetical protein
MRLFPTAMRQNRLYYKIYCVGLNTVFATALPLLSLLYLNTKTVAELRKMVVTTSAVSSAPIVVKDGDRDRNGTYGGGGTNGESHKKSPETFAMIRARSSLRSSFNRIETGGKGQQDKSLRTRELNEGLGR